MKELIKLSPNPASDFLHFELPENISETTELSIIDLQGRNVSSQDMTSTQSIDINSLPVGMYLLRIVAGDQVFTGRFIKD